MVIHPIGASAPLVTSLYQREYRASSALPYLVFVHGWGFDANLWNKVRSQLNEFDSETVDLGFFGESLIPSIPYDRQIVAIGHSLGVAWLLCQAPFLYDKLVSINGFPYFLETEDYRGVKPRVLEYMQRQFESKPLYVLENFYTACNVPWQDRPGLSPQLETLQAALGSLAEWDGRQRLQDESDSVWVLASARDAVVSLGMTHDAFQSVSSAQIYIDERAGHVLPLTDPNLCVKHIRKAIYF